MKEQTLDIEALREEFGDRAKEFADKATAFAKEQPHLAVGLALGVGWILGNGLSPRIVGAAARLGWKAALGGALAGSGLAGILGNDSNESSPVRSSQGESHGSA